VNNPAFISVWCGGRTVGAFLNSQLRQWLSLLRTFLQSLWIPVLGLWPYCCLLNCFQFLILQSSLHGLY